MKICICDDEMLIAQDLRELIEDTASEENMEAAVNIVTSGDELLGCAKEYDAVFLDIEMPKENGLDIGKAVLEINPEIIIIMATAHSEKMRDSIHIGVRDFITKPYKKEDVKISLDIIKKKSVGQRELQVYCQRNKCTIRERDIKKISAYNGYVNIYAGDNIFRKEVSLRRMLEELEEGMFFQIDRKNIVSLAAVEKYENGFIYIGRDKMKVARDRKKSFEKAYIEYDLNYKSRTGV